MRLRLRYVFLALALPLTFLPLQLRAQCTVNVSPTADTLCLGGSTTLTASVPAAGNLLTTMNAGNNHRGNMFDLTAINTVTITSFDGSPMATTGIAIYYRSGTHVGFETNSAGWTLAGTATNVVPIGAPTPTPFPIPINVTIPAGQTYAFYITSTNVAVSLNYTNGTAVGNVLSADANLQFKEGKGMEYPFTNGTNTLFQPRNWNGRIHYSVPVVSSYLWSTGATTPSISVSPLATTTYSVTATSSGTCTAAATVTVGAPSVNLGADTSYCNLGAVPLDAGAGNAAYLWSNGATTQTIIGIPGANTVQVTDSFGCTAGDTITIIQNAAPTVLLGADTLICGTSTLLLDAGNPGGSYSWSNSDTSQTSVIHGSGIYSVSVRDVNGCTGSDTITVSLGNPSINLGADTTLCNAAATILNAGGGWSSILWSNGSTNNFINVNATNTYSVTAVDSLGCPAGDTIQVTASGNPFAGFGISGNSTCTVASVVNGSQNGISFLWIWGDGNTSTGPNPAPHTYAQAFNGNIMLIVTNPCGVDTLELPFGCVGTADADLIDFHISPNPSHGLMQLSVNGLHADAMTASVLNLQGQRVFEREYVLDGNAYSGTLDLSHLAVGVYFLRLSTEDGQYTRRIVIE